MNSVFPSMSEQMAEDLKHVFAFILFPKYRALLADALWKSGQRDKVHEQLDQAFADQIDGGFGPPKVLICPI